MAPYVIAFGFEHRDSSPEIPTLREAIRTCLMVRVFPHPHGAPRIECPSRRTVEQPDGLTLEERRIIHSAGL